MISLAWLLCGIIGHIWLCHKLVDWYGTPIWKEPLTYLMFVPSMILGPIMLVVAYKEQGN